MSSVSPMRQTTSKSKTTCPSTRPRQDDHCPATVPRGNVIHGRTRSSVATAYRTSRSCPSSTTPSADAMRSIASSNWDVSASAEALIEPAGGGGEAKPSTRHISGAAYVLQSAVSRNDNDVTREQADASTRLRTLTYPGFTPVP